MQESGFQLHWMDGGREMGGGRKAQGCVSYCQGAGIGVGFRDAYCIVETNKVIKRRSCLD